MNIDTLTQAAVATLIAVGWKILGAFALWLLGRWLIAFALRILKRALVRQQFDATLARYLDTGLSVVLNIALVIAVLGFFGVETTTFAALLAAGGVAIGVAWGGLLANFAAGPVLCVRPYCSNANYWQVYFDTNRMVREAFGAAGFPAPMPAYAVTGPQPALPPDATGRG